CAYPQWSSHRPASSPSVRWIQSHPNTPHCRPVGADFGLKASPRIVSGEGVTTPACQRASSSGLKNRYAPQVPPTTSPLSLAPALTRRLRESCPGWACILYHPAPSTPRSELPLCRRCRSSPEMHTEIPDG